jgi:hypothetical protein
VNLSFNVDTSQLDQLARFTSAVRGNLDKDLAKAMTLAAYDARDYLKNVTPRYVDQPTKWTLTQCSWRRPSPVTYRHALASRTPQSKALLPQSICSQWSAVAGAARSAVKPQCKPRAS